jgi:hypothetical protein
MGSTDSSFAGSAVGAAVGGASGPSRAKECAAVIYAPGLFEKEDGRSLAHFAERLARALDQQSAEVAARYEARPASVEVYGGGGEAELREIVRSVPGGEPEVTHRVYFLDYQSELSAARGGENWVSEAWALATTLWVMSWRFFAHGGRARSLAPSQKAATAVAGAALGVLAAYLVWVVAQGLGILAGGAKTPTPPMDWFWGLVAWADGVLAPLTRLWWGGWADRALAFLSGAAGAVGEAIEAWDAWLIAAGLGVLSFKRVRVELARGIDLFLLTARYFISGRGRAACTGRFHDLLEHVAEENAGPIDVVGYSMGSLVAIDALFPWRGLPRGRGGRVRALTTIGCPFDFVRAFWPDYFEGREAGVGTRWINVYSPVDLLGSNFCDQAGAVERATRGINTRATAPQPGQAAAEAAPGVNVAYDHLGRVSLSWLDAFTFEALVAHSQYWVRGDARAESCLGVVVAELYGARG